MEEGHSKEGAAIDLDEKGEHHDSKWPRPRDARAPALFPEVVVDPEVRDLLFADHPSERVPELGLLEPPVLSYACTNRRALPRPGRGWR